MAVCFTLFTVSDFQTKYKAMPIKMYSVVQTGAKIQLGGLNDGLFATAYQPLTPDDVKIPATLPTSNGIKTAINNFM